MHCLIADALIDPETHAAVGHNSEFPAALCWCSECGIKSCREQIHARVLLFSARADDGR